MTITRRNHSLVCLIVFAHAILFLSGCMGGEPPRNEEEAAKNYKENVEKFGPPKSQTLIIIAITICTVAVALRYKKKKLPILRSPIVYRRRGSKLSRNTPAKTPHRVVFNVEFIGKLGS